MFIAVGAAFQPRLNDYGVFSWLESHSHQKGVRVTSFRGWKATPTKSWC